MSADGAVDVRLEAVRKEFAGVVAVEDLTLDIPRGMFFALLGPSGCGKTTTLRMIAGFERPTRGEVFIRGARVTEVPAYRRDYAMVFQSFALFPHLTVAQNVAFGLRMRRVAGEERRRRVADALALVKLVGLEERYTRQLSGGQQQRVALARAIVVKPAVLLLDEPLGALDKMLREEMQVELRELQRQLGTTTVFVTHDQEEALTMSDRIAVMREGRIEQLGPPREVYERPASEFVASFLGVSNLLAGVVTSRSGDEARIDLGITEIVARAPGARVGDRLRLAIRPEKIRLGAADAGLRARVRKVVYRGMTTHVYLDCGAAPLIAYLQNASSAELALAEGDEVGCHWEPDSVVTLAGG